MNIGTNFWSLFGRTLHAHDALVHVKAATRMAAVLTQIHFFFLFFPEAVTDHFTRPGPVFFDASFLVTRLATLAGRQAGYPRFSPALRPQGLPVFTSTHFSPNHLPRPAFLRLARATSLPFHPVIRARPTATTALVLLRGPCVRISRRVNLELFLGLALNARPKRRVRRLGGSHYLQYLPVFMLTPLVPFFPPLPLPYAITTSPCLPSTPQTSCPWRCFWRDAP